MLNVDYGSDMSCLSAWQMDLSEAIGYLKATYCFLGGTPAEVQQDAIEQLEKVAASIRQRMLQEGAE